MPRIQQYRNEVYPNPAPMAELAAASAKNGYYIGNMLQEGFNAFGRGISKAQSDMEAKSNAAKDLAEQEDIANLTVAFAMKDAELAVKWKQTASSTNPAEISTAQSKFMQDMTGEYNALYASAKTPKGRMYSAKARASGYASQYISTAADAMNITGEAAVSSVNEVVTALSKAAASDPGNVEAIHEKWNLAVEAQTDANGLDAKRSIELLKHGHAAIAKSSMDGMILNNPDAAIKALDDPKYNKYLTGEEVIQYRKDGAERKKSIIADKKTAETAANEERKQTAKDQLIALEKTITTDLVTGKSTVPENFLTNLDQLAKENKGYVDVEDVRSMKDYARKLAAKGANNPDGLGVDTAIDPNTFADFTAQAKSGKLTRASVYDAAADGLLSEKHKNFFLSWIDRPETENKEMTKFNSYLDGYKQVIIKSSMMGDDAAGTARYNDFNMDMMEMLPELKAKGLNPKQIDEYVRENVPRYQIGQTESDEMTKRMEELGVLTVLPNNIDPLPAPDQQTPLEDILGGNAAVTGSVSQADPTSRSIVGAARHPKLSADKEQVFAGLMPEARPSFEKLVANVEARGVPLKLVEGRRTQERQAQLFAQGRTTPGQKVTWTMNSKHLKGIALDMVPADLADTRDWSPDSPEWDIIGEEAAKLGLKWGVSSKPGEKDKPHIEWVGTQVAGL